MYGRLVCIKNLDYLSFVCVLHIYKVLILKKIAFFEKHKFTFLNKRPLNPKVFEKDADIYNTKAKSIVKV